jgi:molybdopterin molybdotransferase
MQLLNVDTLDAARQKLLAAAGHMAPAQESLPLSEAGGRILARDIVSPIDVPGFDRSTVDGYALRSGDTAAASEGVPAFLRLAGEVEMGKSSHSCVSPGECVQVPTGAMLPDGADAVIMLEYTEPFSDGIAVYSSCAPGENTVRRAEDIKAGQVVIRRGTKLTPYHIGALAALGISRADCFCPLRLALISTGDEIVPPGGSLAPGMVYDVNGPALAALAGAGGYAVTSAVLLPDDEAVLKAAVQGAMALNDVVLVSGGSSKGPKDATAKVLAELSSPGIFTHGLALKPGKPTILSYDEASACLLGGLPGHPASAMMVFELLFSWLYRELTGQAEPASIPARLTVNLASSPGKDNAWPVRLEMTEGGYLAHPIFGKSGLISSLAKADGYFTLGRDREGVAAGETVFVRLF